MASTKDVLDHHLKCFGESDLKGILSDYAPGAVLFTLDGPLKGADAIRPLFQVMIAEFGKPGASFSMKQQFVEGDYAYILCRFIKISQCGAWFDIGTPLLRINADIRHG